MDIKMIRHLNRALINAKARVTRADLAMKLAQKALLEAENALSSGLAKFSGVPTLNEAEKELCRNNNFIYAIKSMRERYNIGLKEAKDLVDAYRDGR